jgi:RNA polymerase sigma factor (sigma-70 family)
MPVDRQLDADVPRLLAEDAAAGWRTFINRHTPTVIALIERAGVRDRDEAMDVYTLVCEHLAANDCGRLRRWNPAKGTLNSWLAVVVRRVAVDWVRSRAGRRRLFGAVKRLGPVERRVFELFFWEGRQAVEITEVLSVERGTPVRLSDVLAALDAIHDALRERHYSELLSTATRAATPASLEAEYEEGRIDPEDPAARVDSEIERRELAGALEAALQELPAEDAAIVRLHYLEGLPVGEVRRALHLSELSQTRVSTILAQLRTRLDTDRGERPVGRPGSGRGDLE